MKNSLERKRLHKKRKALRTIYICCKKTYHFLINFLPIWWQTITKINISSRRQCNNYLYKTRVGKFTKHFLRGVFLNPSFTCMFLVVCLPLLRFYYFCVFPVPVQVVARVLIDSWRCNAPRALNCVVEI